MPPPALFVPLVLIGCDPGDSRSDGGQDRSPNPPVRIKIPDMAKPARLGSAGQQIRVAFPVLAK